VSADTAVQLDGVTYRFGEHRAVDGLDLAVRRGETFGLLGPNGAGKTTTIRLLNTLLPLQEGMIHVFGLDVRRQAMMVRRLLGYVPQQLSIEGALTGRENVASFARHHRPVGAVRLDLLRHPDHLGTRRGRADQAARHPTPRTALVAGKAFAAGLRALPWSSWPRCSASVSAPIR
jgi:ABC-type branched-subunit amino acid transport system ATPase component